MATVEAVVTCSCHWPQFQMSTGLIMHRKKKMCFCKCKQFYFLSHNGMKLWSFKDAWACPWLACSCLMLPLTCFDCESWCFWHMSILGGVHDSSHLMLCLCSCVFRLKIAIQYALQACHPRSRWSDPLLPTRLLAARSQQHVQWKNQLQVLRVY